MTLGQRLRARRKELGLTVRDISAMLGISHAFVAQVERGVRAIPSARLADFARSYELTNDQMQAWRLADPASLTHEELVAEVGRLSGMVIAERQAVVNYLNDWWRRCDEEEFGMARGKPSSGYAEALADAADLIEQGCHVEREA